ncbi:phage holin family protein [Pontivivens nitratireducens]|uniref:Phage holin family protein n=1 Tax=Pontivivens nitratireducens TaxID=2758038 RepID=A0A6G7VKG1_9RHOB|nr:phage holin family protein [Pontibrevibacter nitratireducens]QIK40529.1 phage holin family protein [Pontibrevibacter nitratireducens]
MTDPIYTDTTPPQQPASRSTTDLIGDALSHVSSLVRKEVDLARAEVNENLNRAGVAIGLIVGAVVIALTALNVLAAALTAALTEAGIPAGWSALLVGVVLAIIAFVLMNKGLNDLKLSSLAPSRTADNVKRDAQAVKDAYDAK